MARKIKTELRIKDQPFLKAITFSYLLATCLLAVFAIGSYVILQKYTQSEATTAAQINISGSQRMQAKRVVITGNRLVQFSEHSYSSDMTEAARRDLLAAADRLQQAHRNLLDGNPAMNLPDQLSDEIRSIYFDGPESLDIQIKAFVARALALASAPQSELTHSNEDLLYINSAAEGDLMARLKRLVSQYQGESEKNIAHLQNLQQGFMGAILVILLLLLVLFVFRPMVQRIRNKIAALRDAETLLLIEMIGHQKAEQKFSNVVEASPVAILGAHADGCIVLCNRQVEQLFGYTQEELTGMQIEMLMPERFRDKHRQYRAGFAVEPRTRAMGIGRELFGLRRDGHEFPIEVGISAVETPDGVMFMSAIIDISKRRQLEQALRESEQLHRLTLSSLSDAVFISDDDGAFTFICPNSESIFGYSPEEVKAMGNISRLFGGEPVDRSRLKQAQILENSDWLIKDKDGIEHALLVSVKHVDIQNGTTLYSCRDITILKQAEASLRDSEQRFRMMAEVSGVSIFLFRDKFIYANPAALAAIGYSMEETQHLGLADIIHPDFMAEVQRGWAARKRGDATPRQYEVKYFTKSGEVHWGLLHVGTAMYEGMPTALGTVQDITERKRTEEALVEYRDQLEEKVKERTRELVIANEQLGLEIGERERAEETSREMALFAECNPAPVLKLGRDGKVLLANQASARLSGEQSLIGKAWSSLVSSAPDLGLLLKGSKPAQMECQCCNRTFLFTYQPIKKQSIIYAYGTDISDLRNLEHQLLQSQKMEAVGQLAGGIAHDFNSLLGVILGHGDMMRDDIVADAPLRDSLEEIMQAGNRAKGLVKDLLDFSRPGGNEREPLRLAEVIKESAGMLRVSLPIMIRIHIDIRARKDHVLASSGQIGQVLMNLGINAGDAIGDRKGEISIALSRVQVDDRLAVQYEVTAGAYLRLTVSDTGRGMNEETMSHIFEPFFTSNDIGEGTGLGLAVVHGIVKGHQGFITVDSDPGKGSSFHVYLPAMAK